mgnify:FL=1|tara:strand:+ start:56 stop:562 length:507 start_codon:yes stop_codon:yes gene_type:complete
MGQEFYINSQELEDKIRKLLPTQGGYGAGLDLSASTQIIPIIDVTESAEGSGVRPDLQSSLSFKTSTGYFIQNATNTILINTPGYFRVFGRAQLNGSVNLSFNLFDSATSKDLVSYGSGGAVNSIIPFDFIVYLPAGDTFRATSTTVNGNLLGVTRQLADIDGNLTSP